MHYLQKLGNFTIFIGYCNVLLIVTMQTDVLILYS